MKLLYADTWMIEALKAANKTTAALLDLSTLLSTVSVEDVVSYLEMNKSLEAFLPLPLTRSFKVATFEMRKWLSEKQIKQIEDVLEVRRLSKKTVKPVDASDENLILTADILDDDTILVHYIPRGNRSMRSAREKAQWVSDFADRVMRQMAMQVRFEDIAALPVMRWYLEARQTVLKPNTVV